MISGTTFYIIERESDAGHDSLNSILGAGDEFENTNLILMVCCDLAQQRPFCQVSSLPNMICKSSFKNKTIVEKFFPCRELAKERSPLGAGFKT